MQDFTGSFTAYAVQDDEKWLCASGFEALDMAVG